MPTKVNGSNSRTASKKNKSAKLKWWYILPVIAIVAIAGYAIVRFSEAGTNCRPNKYCWGPTQFKGTSKGSIKYDYGFSWNPTVGTRSFYVNTNASNSQFCVLTGGGSGNGISLELSAQDGKGNIITRKNIGDISGCMFVPKNSSLKKIVVKARGLSTSTSLTVTGLVRK